MTDANGMRTGYSACVGSAEPLFLTDPSTEIDPPNATCGSYADPQENLFCTLVSVEHVWMNETDPGWEWGLGRMCFCHERAH